MAALKHGPPDDAEIAILVEAATHTAAHAYAPYSGFRVGAALRLANGALVTGANVENMSYGLTICAERSAVATMIAAHGPDARITAACVVNLNEAASPPCGACRQVLLEFMDADAWIMFPGEAGQERRRFSELLPFSFRLPGATQ